MERTSPVSPDSPDQRAYLALGVQVGAHGPHDTFVGREFRPFRRSVPRTPTDDAAPVQLHAYMASAERSVLSDDAYMADSSATCLLGDGLPHASSVLHESTSSAGRAQPNHTTSDGRAQLDHPSSVARAKRTNSDFARIPPIPRGLMEYLAFRDLRVKSRLHQELAQYFERKRPEAMPQLKSNEYNEETIQACSCTCELHEPPPERHRTHPAPHFLEG